MTGSAAERRSSVAAEAAADPNDLTQLRAPEEFRRAIVRDPFANSFRFDFDAARGANPIPLDRTHPGGSSVPRAGYYLDLDGDVIDWYREDLAFPNLAPGSGDGGHFFYLTGRRDATTSDLRWIALRAGYQGDVRNIHIR